MMKKRIVALLCVFAMLFSLLPTTALAEGEDFTLGLSATATVGTTAEERSLSDLRPGDIVTVKITVPANTELSAVQTKLLFDKEKFEVVTFEDEGEIVGVISTGLSPEQSSKQAGWANINTTDYDVANAEGYVAIAATGLNKSGKPYNLTNTEAFALLCVELRVKENAPASSAVFEISEALKFAHEVGAVGSSVATPYTVGIPDAIPVTVAQELSSVTLTGGLTTPVKKDLDQSEFTSENPNVGVSVSWSPALVDNRFAASTVYTATVTVSLEDGYVWADGATVTADGLTFQKDGKLFKATKTFNATEDKWEPTVTTNPTASVTYGDTVKDTDIEGGEMAYKGEPVPGTFVWKDTVTSYGDAGTKNLTAVFKPTNSADYAEVDVDVQVTVAPKTIAAPTAAKQTYTFNGEEQTFALDGFDADTMTVSGNKMTNVGKQTVTVALKDKENYEWADGGSVDKTYTFAIAKADAPTGVKADLNVYFGSTEAQTFGLDRFTGIPANAGSLTVKDEVGALTGDDILAAHSSTGFQLKEGAAKGKTASWTVTISSDNYKDIIATVTITTVDIEFTGAEQAVTVNAQPTYGMTWDALVKVDGSKITATVDGAVPGSYKLVQSGIPSVGKQTYDILFTSNDGKYANIKVLSGELTVAPKRIDVTVSPVTVEYGAAIPAFTATAQAGALVGEDTVEGLKLDLKLASEAVKPGQYTVTGTAKGNPNYTVTIKGTNALTISKAALTLNDTPAFAGIKANDAKNATAEALLAAVQADNATLDATYANGTSTLKAVWSLTSGKWNAKGGTYTYTATLTPADEECFAFTAATPVTVTFTVSAVNAALTLDTTAVTKAMAVLDAATTYEQMGLPKEVRVAYNNDVAATTYAITGWSMTVAQIQAVDATNGDRELTLTPTFDAPAWATLGTVPTFKLIVTAKYSVTVTLTQKPTDITYGDKLTAPVAKQSAIDNGVDESASFVYTYTGTTVDGKAYDSTKAPTAAGTYTVTATLNSATHRGKASAEFSIAKRTAELQWNNAGTRTYDGKASNVTAVVTNLVGEDVCAVTVTGGTETKAGTYTATATVLSNPNYALPETATCKYTIKTVEVTAPAADVTAFTYNGEEQTYKLTENDAYSISGNKQTKAGDYTVTVALKDKENYEWAGGGSADKIYTFTIAKANRTVSVEDASVTLLPNSLTATIKPSVSEAKDGAATYTFTSDKTAAVTVNNAGLMTAVGNDANVTVTVTANATDNYNAASTTVTVKAYKRAVNGANAVITETSETLVAQIEGSKIVVRGVKVKGQTVTVTMDLVAGFKAVTDGETITVKYGDTVVDTYTVDDSNVVDVPADVTVHEKPVDVKIPEDLKENEAAKAVKDAATKIENLNTAVAKDAVAEIEKLKVSKAAEIAAAITGAFKVNVDVNVKIQPVAAGDKSLTVDITPSITYTAKPDASNNGSGSDVTLDTQAVTTLSSKVKVSVKLVDGFKPTVAKHTHNGKVEWLKVTLEDVEGGKAATWYQDTFSQVELLEDDRVAEITFTMEDGTVQTVTYRPKDIGVAVLPTDSKAGYTFNGWTIEEKTYSGTLTDEMLTAINGTHDAKSSFSAKSQGGGGGGATKYAVEIGKDVPVTAKPTSASKGNTVTLTVKAGALNGKALVVTDADGKEVKLTKVNDTTYTFVMPAGAVAIGLKDAKPAMSFSDVSESFWAHDAIQWAYENGYVKGKTEDTYQPAGTVNRQQIWMILARMAGENPASMAEAKAWAVEKGLTDGSNPTGNVTRQQMVTMLYRYSTMQGYASKSGADLKTFPDAASVAGYAEEAMKWSVANNVVGGTTQGTLNPSGNANRAQFAVILYRFAENVAK